MTWEAETEAMAFTAEQEGELRALATTCGIYPFHRKRVTPDHFGINVHCLEDFDPEGVPVRQAIGAAMM